MAAETLTSGSPLAVPGTHETVPLRPLRAVVTDLDGVLTDTETVLVRAINRFLAEESLAPLQTADARAMVGLDNDSWWERIRDMRGLTASLEEYTRRVDVIAREMFARDLAPADGAHDLIADIKSRGVPLALATSAEYEWAAQRLDLLGLTDAFDVVVTGDRITRHKPHPEIYLTATRELGVAPDEALAIEDSPAGIRSASDAGLFTIAIRTQWMVDADQSRAHRIAGSLREIDLDALGLPPAETEGGAQ